MKIFQTRVRGYKGYRFKDPHLTNNELFILVKKIDDVDTKNCLKAMLFGNYFLGVTKYEEQEENNIIYLKKVTI